MVTIKDIARELGVSHATVSYVLNGKAKQARIGDGACERIKAAAFRLGYQRNELARSMITGKTNFIAYVSGDLSWEYESRTLAGVVREAERQGFFVKIVFASPNESFVDTVRRVVGQRPSGVFFHGLSAEAFPVAVKEFHRHGIPFATTGANPVQPVGIRVCPDNVNGGVLAAEHLLDLGHRGIAFASGDLTTAYATQRHQGFLDALRRRRVRFQRRNLVCEGYPDEFERAMERLLASSKRPSAIFCAGDPSALLAVRAARKTGLRVPEDFSVVGYANMWMASYCDPPLTTVEEPFEELGAAACALLLEEIGREIRISFSEELSQQLPVRLVVRRSTAEFGGKA